MRIVFVQSGPPPFLASRYYELNWPENWGLPDLGDEVSIDLADMFVKRTGAQDMGPHVDHLIGTVERRWFVREKHDEVDWQPPHIYLTPERP